MKYYRLASPSGHRLVAETESGAYDLTTARSTVRGFGDLVAAADICSRDVDAISRRLVDDADEIHAETLKDDARRPLDPDEVWAAGVTYEISEQARESESAKPDVYMDVYDADRPEVFFKATPSRTVGPNEGAGIRGDSDWDVPEPELGLVLYDGETVGYTVGNDMSSRDIEGQNPLYLPQAKVYDRCCAIGPCIVSASDVDDPHDLEIEMEIRRAGDVEFTGTTSTAKMARECEELRATYCQHNAVPELSVLLTGTSLVPPEEFTLQAGDTMAITIEDIGTLTNDVVVV